MPNVNIELPEKLHARLKARASKEGKKFYSYLIEILKQEVKKK